MPPAKISNPARRTGPAFKPPRPIKSPAQFPKSSTTAKRAPNAPTSRSAGVSKKSTVARTSFRSALASISSSSEAEDEDEVPEDDDDDDDVDDMEEDDESLARPGPSTTAAVEPIASQEIDRPAIPSALLARLLCEGFEDKDMKIQREAMAMVGKYMETFVREAVARARFERNDAGLGGGIEDGFLQVEDLEKLAPQLVLDF